MTLPRFARFSGALVAALLLGAPAFAGGNHTPGGGTTVPTPAPVVTPVTPTPTPGITGSFGAVGMAIQGRSGVFAQGVDGSGAAMFARNVGQANAALTGRSLSMTGENWSGTHGSGFGPSGAVQGFSQGGFAGFSTFGGPGCGC